MGCRYDCGWVAPGTIVEEGAYKCILKVCEDSQIKDYSFPDMCNCCIYNGVLYPNGGMLTDSLCFTIICVNGTWVQMNTFTCSHCIVRDDPHYMTFKGTWYTFHSHCCNTLIQKKEFGYSTINHVWGCFGNCPPEFFRPGPSCILDIRIQHDEDTFVVMTVTGDILVNGDLVNGFFGNGLFIFRDNLAIIAVTFDGVVVAAH
ncbi:uncharacterized protein LOC143041320 [Oratosquilla oratoria]|uniref:uncharacterized protein LOC143041320 n=1 Tax=Oratosquilla oratoria TaxID=337810 RepID=UPI003F774D88